MLSSFTIFQSSVGDLYIKTPKLIECRLRFFNFFIRQNFQLLFRIISFVAVVTKNIFGKVVKALVNHHQEYEVEHSRVWGRVRVGKMIYVMKSLIEWTLWVPTPENGQTKSNNLQTNCFRVLNHAISCDMFEVQKEPSKNMHFF